jgi:heme-degrading monooxygenase HmoA
MYMNIAWGRIKPGMWPEYERLFLQADASTIDLPGFVCRWLLRDLDDSDAGFALSLWESADDVARLVSDATVTQMRENKFAPLFSGEYSRHVCEVRVASPGALGRLLQGENSGEHD